MKTSFSLTLIIVKDFYQIFKFIYFKCAWLFYITILFYIAKYLLNKYIFTTILFTSNKGLLDLDSKFNLQSKFNKKDVFNRHFFDERPNFIWQERLHKMLKDEKKFKVIKESIYTKLLKHHEGMVKMLNKVEQIQLRAESINLPIHIRMKALKIYKRVKQSLKKCLLVNEAVKRQLKDHLTFVEMPARKRLFKSIHELRYIESPDLLNEIMSELADEFNFIELDDTIPNLEKMYKDKANYLNQKLNLLKNKK